jgi:hypothetical protein
LCEKPDFRQAVENDPQGPCTFHSLENQLGRFAELEIGRIEQALLLLPVQQAFRREELEYIDFGPESPTVRCRALAKLVLGFGEGDVE